MQCELELEQGAKARHGTARHARHGTHGFCVKSTPNNSDTATMLSLWPVASEATQSLETHQPHATPKIMSLAPLPDPVPTAHIQT